LSRLQISLDEFEVFKFDPTEFVPAPAQGVLVYQTRKEDINTRRILNLIHHRDIVQMTNVERKVLQMMDGGCHIPLGVYCQKDQLGYYHVWAAYSAAWDEPITYVNHSSATTKNLAEEVYQLIMG
jgi:hydroxymethylbilane synthase